MMDSTDHRTEREIQFPWETRARLKGMARKQAVAVIISTNLNCFFCKLPLGYGEPDLHHIDENPTNNRLANLALSHHGCNSSDFNRKKARTATTGQRREREWGAATSEETNRAVIMRPRWNNWIDSKPFVQIQLKALAFKAPHTLGIGSSITYTRYINEDIAGGILEYFEIEGEAMVRLNPNADTRMLREQKEREQ